MITNRPKFLEENLLYYKNFPKYRNFDIDYTRLPPLLNFDFHTLNGILPLTTPMFNYIGDNGNVDGKKSSVVFVNPSEEEYQFYESIGVNEFQAIQIVMNCYAFEEQKDASILGIPYNVSLLPMTKNGEIDPWHINLLRQFDLEQLCQEGGEVFTDFSPFSEWKQGLGMSYQIFSNSDYSDYTESLGFSWGMYFLSPVFDKRDVIIPENHTFSKQMNAKFRHLKSNLYFKKFQTAQPRRLYGCDSPIELFVLQGLFTKNLHPEIQTSIFKNGEIVSNYYKMQEDEIWIGQEKLITSADLYFPNKKIAIFCDGKEFHDIEKDKRIDASLNEIGIKSLRYSGKEITENLEDVVLDIEKEYKK